MILTKKFMGTFPVVCTAVSLFICSGSINAQIFPGPVGIGTSAPASKLHVVGGHIAASNDEALSAFVQLWSDNAIIWKNGHSGYGGLRFGCATSLGAASWSEKMRLKDNGNLGIGTENPTSKLHVEGNGYFNGDLQVGPEFHTTGYGKKLDFGINSNTDPQWIARYNAGSDASELRVNISDEPGAVDRFVIGYTNYNNNVFNPLMHVNANGVVGIGTTVTNSADYKLYVAGGGVRSTKVKVDAGPWADYVFHASYRLRPLSEVEQYIQQHHHLPEVPSAEEVAKDGIDLGDNQTTLLKKVEELTLYLIEQNKKQEKQQQLIEDQRLLLQNQQQRLDELEKKLKEKK